MFAPRRPDKKRALKELKSNLYLFGTLVLAARTVPYILSLWGSGSSE